jgi:hypothetical protein
MISFFIFYSLLIIKKRKKEMKNAGQLQRAKGVGADGKKG